MVLKVYQIHVWIKKGGQWHTPNVKDRQYLSCLTKISTSCNRHFSFNIFLARSNNKFEGINYEVLEYLKDGDAFADKYNRQLLKFISPNMVMVFSNETPVPYKISGDRWRVF